MANISKINGLLINADSASYSSTASYVNGITVLPAVQVFRTSSLTVTNVFSNITFNTASIQNNTSIISHSAASTDRIYVGQSGLYQIAYHASVGSSSANDYIFQLTKNGNTYISGSLTIGKNSSTDITLASTQTLVQLSANDYINLQVRSSASLGGIMQESASMFVIKMDGITGQTGPAGPSGSGAAFPYTGSAIISGSLIVTGSVMGFNGFTGSLLGTSSFSDRATSASMSDTSSYSLTLGASIGQNAAGTVQLRNSVGTAISSINVNTLTASLAFTSSYLNPGTYVITSSWAQSASNAVNAQTASFLPLGTYSITSSWAQSASNAVSASIAGTSNTANIATSVGVTDTTTGVGPYYVMFVSSTTGNPIARVDSAGMLFNATTNTLTTTSSFSSNTFTNLKTVRLEMGVSSTTAITTGAKGRKPVSFNGTIVGWRLVADQSTTTTVDIWKANLAIPTVANTITAAAKPALTAAQLAGSTTLTGWTTSVADGDVFILNVDSNNNATYLLLEIDIVLTNA